MKRLFLMCFFLFLPACQFIGTIFNGAHKVAVTLMDDRSFSDDMADTRINLEIRDALMQQDARYGLDIEVTVFEGTVLLNGALPNLDLVGQVMQTAWSVEGVQKVHNYIRISDVADIVGVNENAAVSAKIRAELAMTKGIASSNYKIVMENNTVYILGIMADDAELSKAVAVIKDTVTVEKVIPLMRYKTQ
ncbi:MAG: BON domain-containing protein [Lactobacillales bacterium]|jgi:osmotically-inducible protein OsmY|nr:BON domain-containing protein [Lactobacillales bacterium]